LRPIDDFPGYLATEDGRIYSTKSQKYLRPKIQNSGYGRVCLCRSGGCYTKLVHRLVAAAYIDNPLGLREVNHIDGIKANNAARNLEWVNKSQNTKHSYDIGLRESQRKAISCANVDRCSVPIIGTKVSDGTVVTFGSMSAAGRSGFSHSKISLCVSGKRKSHGGYLWKAA
jgi:hypothetical protein